MFLPLHDANPLRVIPLQAVTVAIIGGCVVAFLWQSGLDAQTLSHRMLSFGLIPASLLGRAQLPPELAHLPPSLTLVTSMFLHASWLHLLGNMLFLWVFGDNVEDAMGHVRFLAFYLLCGVAGTGAHVFAVPDSTLPLIGASAAVSGILGAYLMLHPRVKVLVLAFNRVPVRLPAYLLIGAWLAFQLFNVFVDTASNVAWTAHLGGFVAGAILVVPLRRRGVELFDRGLAH